METTRRGFLHLTLGGLAVTAIVPIAGSPWRDGDFRFTVPEAGRLETIDLAITKTEPIADQWVSLDVARFTDGRPTFISSDRKRVADLPPGQQFVSFALRKPIVISAGEDLVARFVSGS